jgi:hypothetical protein
MVIAQIRPATAWEAGRLDSGSGPRELLFGCMHEDAGIELASFPPGGRVFCIASAGCTAMHLSAQHEVIAVDINPLQIAYVESRLAGGPMRTGKAEQLLTIMRRFALLVGWSQREFKPFSSWISLTTSSITGVAILIRKDFASRSIYCSRELLCGRSTPPPYSIVCRDNSAE